MAKVFLPLGQLTSRGTDEQSMSCWFIRIANDISIVKAHSSDSKSNVCCLTFRTVFKKCQCAAMHSITRITRLAWPSGVSSVTPTGTEVSSERQVHDLGS